MAVTATALDSLMIARYQTGTTASGAPILRKKTLTVKATASHQDIVDVANALYNLTQHTLTDVQRNDCFALTEE